MIDQEAIYRRFFHGPIFQVLREIDGISSDGLLAQARVEHAPIGDPLITAPLLLEAAFQAAGMHEMLEAHRMGLPSSIDEVQQWPLQKTVKRSRSWFDTAASTTTSMSIATTDHSCVFAVTGASTHGTP